MDKIKVIPSFIDDNSIDIVKAYLDDDGDHFEHWPYAFQYGMRLGVDYMDNQDHIDTSRYGIAEDYLINQHLPKCIEMASRLYDIDKLYMADLWAMKSTDGSKIAKHNDQDHGQSKHLTISIVTYLNDLPDNGALYFFNLDYAYYPIKGETIMFLSGPAKYNHKVLPVKQDRYTIVSWLTDDPDYDMLKFVK
jgi:2OG-Fe(II) oxygenase superfamily